MCTYVPPLSSAQGHLVSRFGWRRGIQPPHLPTFHAGIDISISGAPVGTIPIYAVADGVVELAGSNDDRDGPLNGYGNCVAIRHAPSTLGLGPSGEISAQPTWSFYAHQDHLASTWAQCQQITRGTILGYVGRTNNGKFPTMGPHLHFEVRHAARDGRSPYPGPYRTYNLDPQIWLAERGITFGARGVILTQSPLACDPATLQQVAAR